MTDKTKDGGPAFPAPYDGHGGGPVGMSLRDWFAGQAMAALVSSGADVDPTINVPVRAYVLADAMLKARGTDQ